MHHPPHPSAPQPAPSVTFPPSTSSTTNRLTPLGTNAGAFIPVKKVSIKSKNASGQEATLDTLKGAPLTTIPPNLPSPASVKKDIKRQSIRIESHEKKEERLAEERAKEGEGDDKSNSSDALVRANEATARREVGRQESLKGQQRKLLLLDIIELEPTKHVSHDIHRWLWSQS
jgi:hypothetical protein